MIDINKRERERAWMGVKKTALHVVVFYSVIWDF